MGLCISAEDRRRREHSDAIDLKIEQDRNRLQLEKKVLVLGSGNSGKSTIVKQMRILHQEGFSDSELAEYKPSIYKVVLEAVQSIILFMKKTGFECDVYSNRALAEMILDFKFDDSKGDNIYFPPELARWVHEVWNDPIMPMILGKHGSDFYLIDSAPYFLGEVLRIGSLNYVPNETDVLRCPEKLAGGIKEIRFSMGPMSITMIDVGQQRSERKKWIHCFESVTSVMFCAPLDEYDQVLLEEKTQNRMAESLLLFESIINSRWFLRSSIILLLTKIDVFKRKLSRVPLERYFPEYTGGTDINKAAKYILWKYMQANRARLRVYPHLAQETDTTNLRLVFATVKETILQNAYKGSGIL